MSTDPFFFLISGFTLTGLFWFSMGFLFHALRQKRLGFALLPFLLASVCYCMVQGIFYYLRPIGKGPLLRLLSQTLVSLPRLVFFLLLVMIAFFLALIAKELVRYERITITDASIKEAVDSLPSGVCFYLENGRIFMINQTMERLCEAAAGQKPLNGNLLKRQFIDGPLQSGCARIMEGDLPMISLPSGSVWSIQERPLVYQGHTAHLLVVAEVTEIYRQTLSLQKKKEELSSLNERLVSYNREIVFLTTEREILGAKARIHDELGENLLAIRSYIQNGGSEEDRKEIEERLKQNLSFLLADRTMKKQDEYELLVQTALKLGVHVVIEGELPQSEQLKPVVSTAIHECFTNTLRHAHGDRLQVSVKKEKDQYEILFRNNGEMPKGQIEEKGGLKTLREMVLKIPGAGMEILTDPEFVIRLVLPDLPEEFFPSK